MNVIEQFVSYPADWCNLIKALAPCISWRGGYTLEDRCHIPALVQALARPCVSSMVHLSTTSASQELGVKPPLDE